MRWLGGVRASHLLWIEVGAHGERNLVDLNLLVVFFSDTYDQRSYPE